MKRQHCRKDFVLKEVLNRMLRILHSISQDLEKLRDRKSLHIKQTYGFDEVIHDDVCYEDNEENEILATIITTISIKRIL